MSIERKEIKNAGVVTSALVLALVATGCDVDENNQEAGKLEIKGPGCDDLSKVILRAGDQRVNVPAGCTGNVTLYPYSECRGTFVPSAKTSNSFNTSTLEWDLNIDPTITGDNAGETTISCTIREDLKPKTPTPKPKLPTPTPRIDQLDSVSYAQENPDQINVKLYPLEISGAEPLEDLLDKAQDYIDGNGEGSINGLIPNGLEILTDPDGLVIGFKVVDNRGRSRVILGYQNDSISPYRIDWYLAESELVLAKQTNTSPIPSVAKKNLEEFRKKEIRNQRKGKPQVI